MIKMDIGNHSSGKGSFKKRLAGRILSKNKRKKKFKLKTHEATAKRFCKTGSGKIMRMKGRQGHFRRWKSKQAKRLFTKMQEVEGSRFKWRVKKFVPYLKR
jgi:large subunit ribosomal protein L35